MSEEITTHIFTDEETSAIEQTLHEHFERYLKAGETFSVSGEFDPEGLEVRVRLADAERRAVLDFHAGAEVDPAGRRTLIEARAQAIEFLHSMFLEYFRGGRWPNPHLEWKEYKWEAHAVFFRGELRDEYLESLADQLLAGDSQSGDAGETN